MGCDQRIYYIVYSTAGQQMAFQLVCVYIHARFLCFDQGTDDLIRPHPSQPHADQRENTYLYPGGNRGDPQAQWYKAEENADYHQNDNQRNDQTKNFKHN